MLHRPHDMTALFMLARKRLQNETHIENKTIYRLHFSRDDMSYSILLLFLDLECRRLLSRFFHWKDRRPLC
jgi:hypothetical protein